MAKTDDILRLLLIDDSLSDAERVTSLVRKAGYAVRVSRTDSLKETEKSIKEHTWDLVLCRTTLPLISPQRLLNLIADIGRDLPCIVLIGEQDDKDDLYEIEAKDIVQFENSKHLLFAISRELESLFVRRLSRQQKHALYTSENRVKALLESSKDAIAYVHEGMHLYVNKSYLTLFSLDPDDAAGLSVIDIIAPSDQGIFKTAYRDFVGKSDLRANEIDVKCVRGEGDDFSASIEFSHAEVENETCTQVVIREKVVVISDEEVSQKALEKVRDLDLVTGLYSRVRFMDELSKTIQRVDAGQDPSGLLYLTLEKFQKINETIGLTGGDLVIKGIADLLQKELKEGELLARYSDHVFTFLIESSDDEHVDRRADVYRKLVDSYISQANGKVIDLQCSVGISRVTENLTSPSVALERADKACIQAQRSGGNALVRYKPTASERGGTAKNSDEASFWIERVRESIQGNNLCLHYQPIVNLHGKEQEIYDVLVRIEESDGSVTLAEEFIQHVEKTEFMFKLDEWVITAALKALTIHRRTHPKTRFFIKLSKQTLDKKNFVAWIGQLLNKYKLPGDSFVFGINETAALDNLEQSKQAISRLKQSGCEFCLEHFGSSGLDFSQSLSELDVDYLKINGAFVSSMAKDTENQAAVKSIIAMSRKAGILSIAEYVSDAKSLALLWGLGADYVMGFYMQAPSANLDYNFTEDDL